MQAYVKNIVYAKKIHDLYNLWDRIYTAVATVTQGMLNWTRKKKIEYCLDLCW
jgi:hypothetical protein